MNKFRLGDQLKDMQSYLIAELQNDFDNLDDSYSKEFNSWITSLSIPTNELLFSIEKTEQCLVQTAFFQDEPIGRFRFRFIIEQKYECEKEEYKLKIDKPLRFLIGNPGFFQTSKTVMKKEIGGITLKQLLKTCNNGDWLLEIFHKSNPKSIRRYILAKSHYINTIRYLMKDKRSRNAIDVGIKFGEGKATQEELEKACVDAYNVVRELSNDTDDWYRFQDKDIGLADVAGCLCYTWVAILDDLDISKEEKERAGKICRDYLPLELWDFNKEHDID